MPRKTKTQAEPYCAITQEDAKAIVHAPTGVVKKKTVKPDGVTETKTFDNTCIIGSVQVKKWLAVHKINGEFEEWLRIIKKLTPTEDKPSEELTAEEVVAFEACKKRVADYLENEASDSLSKKTAESKDELKNLTDVVSSMKFKFSKYAYEAITHVINLAVREILVFTCDNCASKKCKLTKPAHIPWEVLRTKQLAGLYMNTKVVFDAVFGEEEQVDEVVDEVVEEVESADEPEVVDGEEDIKADVVVKQSKARLFQYISNTFKEIITRDARFTGLLLNKKVATVINDLVYQTLDRLANIIKTLLDTVNSKTVTERLALNATKILLQDHVHACTDDIRVVLDVVQTRLDVIKAADEDKKKKKEAEAAEKEKTEEKK